MTTLEHGGATPEGLVLLSLDGVVLTADAGAQELVGPLAEGDPLRHGGRLAALRLVLRRVAAAAPGAAVRSALLLPSGRALDVSLQRTGAGTTDDVVRVLLRAEGLGTGVGILPEAPAPAGTEREQDVLAMSVRGRYQRWRVEHDVFTGLLSRAGLSAHLEMLAREGGGALAHFDIDGLKDVNRDHDGLGGDLVILAVARTIERFARPRSAAARIGGDEFVLTIPGEPAAVAAGLVADILAAIREPIWTPTGRVPVTASAGVAEVTSGRFPDHAVHHAQAATFLAKRGGGDQVVVQPPEVSVWATDLRSLAQWVDALQKESAEWRSKALTDALTGLPNRRALQETQALLIGAEYRVGVLFLDIDRFSHFNHRYGDSAGDRCLVEVARAMEALLRSDDQIFRKGGEEFVILLPGADQEATRAAGERIRRAVEALAIAHADNDGGVVTVTVAVSLTRPDEDPAEAVERAARVVYAAKVRGDRNGVH